MQQMDSKYKLTSPHPICLAIARIEVQQCSRGLWRPFGLVIALKLTNYTCLVQSQCEKVFRCEIGTIDLDCSYSPSLGWEHRYVRRMRPRTLSLSFAGFSCKQPSMIIFLLQFLTPRMTNWYPFSLPSLRIKSSRSSLAVINWIIFSCSVFFQ